MDVDDIILNINKFQLDINNNIKLVMGNDQCRLCCRPKDVIEVTHKTPFGEVTQRNVIDHNQ